MLAKHRGTTTFTIHETGKHGMRLDGVPAKAPDAHQNDASKANNENKVEIAGSVHKSVVAKTYETAGQINFSGQVKEVKEDNHVQTQGGVTKDIRTQISTTAIIYISGDVEKSLVAEKIKAEGNLNFD